LLKPDKTLTIHEDQQLRLLLPMIKSHHESALFHWTVMRLLGQPKTYKCYANAPQFYVIRAMRVLFANKLPDAG